MRKTGQIKIPKCLEREQGNVYSTVLHAFYDSLENGYGAMLFSKSEVKATESATIPQLEIRRRSSGSSLARW